MGQDMIKQMQMAIKSEFGILVQTYSPKFVDSSSFSIFSIKGSVTGNYNQLDKQTIKLMSTDLQLNSTTVVLLAK